MFVVLFLRTLSFTYSGLSFILSCKSVMIEVVNSYYHHPMQKHSCVSKE